MFKNFKVIAHMKTPIATMDNIILDSIISAAKAKEILKEEFYNGKNICGEIEDIRSMLDTILDREKGVYCTSIGFGDNRESTSSWSKRWDDKNDDIVEFKGKGKKRVDIGAGFYKNYHMPIITKSYKTITFYVRGDMKETKRLLETYMHYLGKKGSQGFGQINKWEFEEIENDYSIIKDGTIMRPIPAKQEKIDFNKFDNITIRQHAVIPPYWREQKELCIIPGVIL